jgi:hypothetical protein
MLIPNALLFIWAACDVDDWLKQLQAAGFPDVGEQESQAGSFDSEPRQHRGRVDWRPTLSELLAACPKEIGTATFVLGSSQGGKRWTATYFDFRNNRMVDDEALCQSGDSPKEAVARLWLAQRRLGGD